MPGLSVTLLFCLVALFFCGVCPPSVVAQDVPVPVKLHVVLLKKVFSLSKTLQGKQLKVVVAYSGGTSLVKDEALSSFIAIGIQATACKVSQLAQEAADADVIYITPGADGAQKFCESKSILSTTGMPSLIETGRTSVAIGIEAGKPKVFINLTRVKVEKQEFSSDLFKVAKIFQ